jgi:L-xylulokinase
VNCAADSLVLAVDAGLSAVKVALYRADGTMEALDENPNTAVRTSGRRSIMDMEALWALVSTGIRNVLATDGGAHEIVGVGLSGHGNGLYLVEPDGSPLLGVTSMDLTAQTTVERWNASRMAGLCLSAASTHIWAGQPLPILSSLMETEALRGDFRLLFCKDWIRYRLTGCMATDRCEASAAGLLDSRTGQWAEEVFVEAGLPRLRLQLPSLRNSYDETGRTTERAARESGLLPGVPVFGGSIDLALASLADGLSDPATLHVTAGTWSINQQPCREAHHVPALLQTITSPSVQAFLRVDSSPTSAINLPVLRTLAGGTAKEHEAWEEALGDEAPGAADPIYLPYPAGAWDLPNATASLLHLRPGLDRPHIVRAVFEGIALGHLRQIRKFQDCGTVDRILLCGGMARSPGWCRLLCDYARLPVVVSLDPHSSARGAALCAWRGLGVEPAATSKRRFLMPQPGRLRKERYLRFLESIGGWQA